MSRKHCQCFDFDAKPADIKKCIREGHRILILMRGVTGSGKTGLVEEFKAEADADKQVVFSSDDAKFQNNPTKNLRKALADDVPLVIVDAAHEERGDIKKLAEIAVTFCFEVFVVEPQTEWRYKANHCKDLSTRNETAADIARKIALILDTPIKWDHFVNGGWKNVDIQNTHIDYEIPIITLPTRNSENMGSVQSSSSNTSTTSVSSTSTTSAKLFSMVPEQKTKVMRDAGTMLDSIDLARSRAGVPSDPLHGFFDGGSYEVPDEWKDPASVKIKNARTQGPELWMVNAELQATPLLFRVPDDELEFAILHAHFNNMSIVDLRHYHLQLGFSKALRLMEMIVEEISTTGLPHNMEYFLEASNVEESFTYSTMTVEEEIRESRIEWYKMKMMAQRHGLGNPDTSSDALIAANLQAELNFGENQGELTREDQENIRYLRSAFAMDNSMIEDVYRDAGCNLETAKQTLKDSYGLREALGIQPPIRSTWSAKVQARPAAIKPQLTEEQKNNHFINPPSRNHGNNILAAQEVAIKARQEMQYSGQAARAAGGMRNLLMYHYSQRNHEEYQKRIRQIDEIIRRGHQIPWFVDLHYMSAEGAVALVNEAIEAVQHFRKIGNHVDKRIHIVTGKGNRSTNGPQIKPRVIALLQKHGYKWKEANEGYYIAEIY